MVKITIPLNPRTKKNSQRIVKTKEGRPFIIPAKEYVEYEKECGWFLKEMNIDCPVNIKCVFYRDSRRRVDLTNLLEAIDDILVKYKVIKDDCCKVLASHDGSYVDYDKEHPRTEITITRKDEDMNVVNLIGNLTKDVEVRATTGASQITVGKFTIAVNDGYGDKQKTSYIPITVFGKQADNCERFLHKGSKVAVTGRIQTGSYEKDGRKIYTTDVIADRVEFLKTEQVHEAVDASELPAKGFTALSDSDIPF